MKYLKEKLLYNENREFIEIYTTFKWNNHYIFILVKFSKRSHLSRAEKLAVSYS